MVTFVLRFYGRFLLARERRGGQHTGLATFIAPTLEFPPEIGEHRAVLAIERGKVASDPKITTVAPTFRAIPGKDLPDAEFLMWDLSQLSISVPSGGGFTLKERETLLDLAVLEALQNRKQTTLDRGNLKPNSRVGSVVHLAGGSAVAKAAIRNSAMFIPESLARSGAMQDNTISNPELQHLADWVEVAIQVKSKKDANGVERGQLALQVRGRQNGTITVHGGDGTQLNFSNLCSTCPRTDRQYDPEFGQFYELMSTPSHSDRLVPIVSHLGQEDCNESAQISYDV
jgi:hypothetical protein